LVPFDRPHMISFSLALDLPLYLVALQGIITYLAKFKEDT